MADEPQKRLPYIALIGIAAIVPLAINRDFGGLFSALSLMAVAFFIHSDRARARARPGFPVIMREQPDPVH